MDSIGDLLAHLTSSTSWGYHHESPSATEPAALAAVALLAHGRETAARPVLDWLTSQQASDGSLGVESGQSSPHWGTGLAVLAWQAAQDSSLREARYAKAAERAVSSILRSQGMPIERGDWSGHDTTLRGWPWVDGTHSWLEPTAINLLALAKSGHGDHPRAREAARMLQDRLLPSGGCNYGNTIVFGQELRAHLQPTGMCLLALAGRSEVTAHVEPSIGYLQRELTARTATASLSYGLLGLAAWQRAERGADEWLAAAAARALKRDASTYKLALLALASMGPACPLIPGASQAASIPHKS
jgi:hypothetical protein